MNRLWSYIKHGKPGRNGISQLKVSGKSVTCSQERRPYAIINFSFFITKRPLQLKNYVQYSCSRGDLMMLQTNKLEQTSHEMKRC